MEQPNSPLDRYFYLCYFTLLEKTDNITQSDISVELVLSQNETAKNAHKTLFSFNDSAYLIFNGNIIDSIQSSTVKNIKKLHLTLGWENILKVALWTNEKPLIHDVLSFIKKSGSEEDELVIFKKSDFHDIFPWLYYGKRFDILRKICNSAKAKAETKIAKQITVYCHLFSDETKNIVASSL